MEKFSEFANRRIVTQMIEKVERYWNTTTNKDEENALTSCYTNGGDTCKDKKHKHDDNESYLCVGYWMLKTLEGEYEELFTKLFGHINIPSLHQFD